MHQIYERLHFRCGAEAPNRVALAPMTNKQSNPDGTLGDDELRWLVRRAQGGFGLVFTCAAYVSAEGKAWVGQLGIAHDEHLPGLNRLAEALHEHDTCALVQLHHAGAKATLAPGLKLGPIDGDEVKGALLDDLDRVVADFVSAALRAQDAGFDGVEIHGANGYIFTQFLSPSDNSRHDQFGGNLEGRARLLRRAMREVRAAVDPAFIVGVRISPVDTRSRRGLLLRDALEVGRWLVDDGADFIHLSLQDAERSPPFEESDTPVARAFRTALPADVPVLAAGNIWTKNCLRAALQAGVDVPVIGRCAIANPDWAARILDDDFQPNLPPWTLEELADVHVGESMRDYLSNFNGLIAGS